MHLPRLALPCLLLSTLTSVAANAESTWSFSGGLGTSQVDTTETATTGKELNSESGNLFSRQVAFEYNSQHYFFGGSIYNADGDIDYKGFSQQGTPIPNGSTYLYIWRTNLYLGKEFNTVVKPRIWIEVGGQLKERHITTHVNNINGYQEDYTWWNGGVGFGLQILGNEHYSWRAGTIYQSMIEPENKPSHINLDIELGTTYSLSHFTEVKYHLGSEFYVCGLARYTYTSIEVSRTQYMGNNPSPIVQPQSEWQDLDLMVSLEKRF